MGYTWIYQQQPRVDTATGYFPFHGNYDASNDRLHMDRRLGSAGYHRQGLVSQPLSIEQRLWLGSWTWSRPGLMVRLTICLQWQTIKVYGSPTNCFDSYGQRSMNHMPSATLTSAAVVTTNSSSAGQHKSYIYKLRTCFILVAKWAGNVPSLKHSIYGNSASLLIDREATCFAEIVGVPWNQLQLLATAIVVGCR